MLNEEALQPPYLSPIVPLSTITASVELPQDPRDPTADLPNPTIKQDSSNPIRKWDRSNPILLSVLSGCKALIS